MGQGLSALLERFRNGERVALARAISVVENERAGFQAFLHEALQVGQRARRIGFTGPPGAGKSSLLAQVATAYRKLGEEAGVVAVDPTSPFSGGALLGDRIRMNDLATDAGIFIRSMATRGSLGGLATTSREVVDLMDAFGFPRVLVETVGVGQTELDITGAADTVVVVLVPESGDGIQAMKAGLMEIADIFIVNKADRPGAERIVHELRTAIALRQGDSGKEMPAHHGVDLKRMGKGKTREERVAAAKEHDESTWKIPILKTVAQSGEGVDAVLEAVSQHQAYLEASGELVVRRRARAARRVKDVVERNMSRRTWSDPTTQGRVSAGIDAIARGEATPYSVARDVVDGLMGLSTSPDLREL
jgi:LAO/AO transport system kinase